MIPFLRPAPPRLSTLLDALLAIERSGVFTNYGPVNTRFEAAMTERVFGGIGGCVTVNNATTGLMLAIRAATKLPAEARDAPRLALIPSFTFAAAAHAAEWAGLQPLFCDIDPETWLPSRTAEEALLARYGERVAVVIPCATFGNSLDLAGYERLARRFNVPVVVDAAAALGSLDGDGRAFGTGCPYPVVYSMHATKAFATAEAGLIHCGDATTVQTLRAMGNFGFGDIRIATMPGLNAKLSEVGALLALARLDGFEEVVQHREQLAARYRERLAHWTFQRPTGTRQAHQFMPVLLPSGRGGSLRRLAVVGALTRLGVGVAHYFSPHLAEHPYFRTAQKGELDVTNDVAARILSLPMSDSMTLAEVDRVTATVQDVLHAIV
jgi:dTDP-4-amino-4,6-dideoxygalactose transaminase